jgi:hypothetical protein
MGRLAVEGPSPSLRISRFRHGIPVALALHVLRAVNLIARRAGRSLLMIATITTGCGGVQGVSFHPTSSVSRRVEDAESMARVGRYAEARAVYVAIQADGTGADRALLGLARLALDPDNPHKDERQAAGYLDRLIIDHPRSAWVAEAQTSRHLLRSIERLHREARRHQSEVERLRRDLQREQYETARLRDERDRLRLIDVELERPRQSQSPPSSIP